MAGSEEDEQVIQELEDKNFLADLKEALTPDPPDLAKQKENAKALGERLPKRGRRG